MASLTVGTTPVQLVMPDTTGTAATNDSALHITNEDAAIKVRYGPLSTVTSGVGDGTTRGNPLAPGATLEVPRPVYGGSYDLWLVAESGTVSVTWNRF